MSGDSTLWTSLDAYRRIQPTAGTVRALVLEYIKRRGDEGATDQEIQQALGLVSQSETPRRGELHKAGLIKDSGRVRPTTSGRNAVVWVAARSEP